MRAKRIILAVAVVALIPLHALASGTWHQFTENSTPEPFSFRVSEYSGTVTITFLGDCTLGGEEKTKTSSKGFFKTIESNGYDFPFCHLRKLTNDDDLTIANLEGVLSDNKLQKTVKTYNFIGPTAYTDILTRGSIECVNLANNHTHDYGKAGYSDTKEALKRSGICWFGSEEMAVWENEEGLLIGFVGVSYSLSGAKAKQFDRQIQSLRDMGCAAIITVMHAGDEYVSKANSYQKQIVKRAAQAGACLVIGHHPHIVQGFEFYEGIPVIYSLGNCSFGGAIHVKDMDALAVQAKLYFSDNKLTATELHLYPISISSDAEQKINNFSPVLLDGQDALRVLDKMEQSTGFSIGEFDPAEGAVIYCPCVTR